MLRGQIYQVISRAIEALVGSGRLPEAVREAPIEVTDTKTPEHGDFACPFALAASKRAGMPPRAIAEALRGELLAIGGELFREIEIAGPGFLNMRLHPAAIASLVAKILEVGDGLAKAPAPAYPRRLNVEFVSVNPNGPITVGSGRGAAFGDTLSRVFAAAGDAVEREYYINDGVNSEQMRLFAESVRAYCWQIIFWGTLGMDGAGWRRSVALDLNNEYLEQYLGPGHEDDSDEAFEESFRQFLANKAESVEIPAKAYFILSQTWRFDIAFPPYGGYAEALRERYRRSFETGRFFPPDLIPEKGYKGDYVYDVSAELVRLNSRESVYERLKAGGISWFQRVSQELMIERQRQDLATFSVRFDRWFSEQSLHDAGKVERALQGLIKSGAADSECFSYEIVREGKEERLEKKPEECGPVWLRSTRWGDDKDRVFTRSDGRPAYIAGDVAYIENKLGERNYDKAYLILGPDHHGYIPRMYAAVQALGYPLDRFEIIIFQIVRFVKDGKQAPMRKRDGNIYELRDLIDELGANIAPSGSKAEQQRIGADVARFFYLMRSHDTHMDFDIDLATKQSDENPVFYVQYAHARICSVIAKAAEAGIRLGGAFDPAYLVHERELALVKKILDLPFEVSRCAADYGVHRLTTYAVELARTYHHFYDACRVIQPDQAELTLARLALCQAARHGLKSTLDLLGVSAPERMDRESPTV